MGEGLKRVAKICDGITVKTKVGVVKYGSDGNKKDKGLKRGSCNRRACQAPNAVWFNHSTERYYCRDCAVIINEFNKDNLNGLDLCAIVDKDVKGPYGCKCRTLAHHLVGDGCDECSPELAKELSEDD